MRSGHAVGPDVCASPYGLSAPTVQQLRRLTPCRSVYSGEPEPVCFAALNLRTFLSVLGCHAAVRRDLSLLGPSQG